MTNNIAAVVGADTAAITGVFSGTKEIGFDFISANELDNSYSSVLIWQDSKQDIPAVIRKCKELRLPSAVVTKDGSRENLENLLEIGCDDVIVLPLPPVLLERRAAALPGIAAAANDRIDFKVFDSIAASNKGSGSFIIQEADFANIYRFVLRLLERLDQKAQLIIFSITSRFRNGFVEPEVMQSFAGVVQRCLRRGDISSLHGRQIAVILMGSDEAGGKGAADRLIQTFYSQNDDVYDISYEIRQINS